MEQSSPTIGMPLWIRSIRIKLKASLDTVEDQVSINRLYLKPYLLGVEIDRPQIIIFRLCPWFQEAPSYLTMMNTKIVVAFQALASVLGHEARP